MFSQVKLSRVKLRINVAVFGLLCAIACPAATLEQLSMDQMSQNATSIVRATVAGSYTSILNSTVYTHYKLRVADTWKGVPAGEVMLPGGMAGGIRQSFPGVPQLTVGTEYVLFLWKSSTGITHLVGLTQGLFEVSRQTDGSSLATRAKIGEMMLDAAGHKVADKAVTMAVTDLKSHVRLAAGMGAVK
ncbi:MAG TPA: hypothetical protein VNH18_24190 [Bryobacteraceae bacterium]|nr:hypothetical protein [Bryobacteraceae bacterium]